MLYRYFDRLIVFRKDHARIRSHRIINAGKTN